MAFRGEGQVTAPIGKLLYVIEDSAHWKEWIENFDKGHLDRAEGRLSQDLLPSLRFTLPCQRPRHRIRSPNSTRCGHGKSLCRNAFGTAPQSTKDGRRKSKLKVHTIRNHPLEGRATPRRARNPLQPRRFSARLSRQLGPARLSRKTVARSSQTGQKKTR